jgi:hypothetical protein
MALPRLLDEAAQRHSEFDPISLIRVERGRQASNLAAARCARYGANLR